MAFMVAGQVSWKAMGHTLKLCCFVLLSRRGVPALLVPCQGGPDQYHMVRPRDGGPGAHRAGCAAEQGILVAESRIRGEMLPDNLPRQRLKLMGKIQRLVHWRRSTGRVLVTENKGKALFADILSVTHSFSKHF